MTYPDECLERAKKATPGPWEDVEELANRLKWACDALKKVTEVYGKNITFRALEYLIEELEAPLEEK